MPDATEWLLEVDDNEAAATTYEHAASRDEAIECLRMIIREGKAATLYQRVDFTVQVDVTVKAPRKRRKTPPPADQPGSDTPTGPGNGAAGKLKEGAAPSVAPREGQDSNPPPVERRTASNLASPGFDCEARFNGDPVCPGPVGRDPMTGGAFCDFHLAQVPPSHRLEMHRIHGSRNRPVRVAHAG